jgi:predicted AAA+ superfamily ATPase
LVEGTDGELKVAVRSVVMSDRKKGKDSEVSDKLVKRVVEWTRSYPLLRRLREVQMQLDPVSVLNPPTDPEENRKWELNQQIAMTLRDVSLFLLVPEDESQPLVAKLADLDLKSAKKLKQWQKIERELIDEGWYEGTERRIGESGQNSGGRNFIDSVPCIFSRRTA